MINRITSFVIATTVAVLLSGCSTAPRYTASGNEIIYDDSADGTKQIAKALATAQQNHKRVLMQFGANWCAGCHQLYNLLKNDPVASQEVKNGFVWILIDLDMAHNLDVDQKYGSPSYEGFPALVILDPDGKQVLKTDTLDFIEAGSFSQEKTVAFLRKWAPK